MGLVTSVGQVALGGVVRVTDSGLGCPDWPLCHGQLIPPFEIHTLIEYSHRLSGALVGVIVLAAALLAWVRWRENRWLIHSITAAFVLVLLAAVLGGVTVYTELKWWIVLLHLSIAEAVVACMSVALVGAWSGLNPTVPKERQASNRPYIDILILSSVLGTFVIILSGSFMTGVGYGSYCGSWPLCGEELFSRNDPYLVHMGHRVITAITGTLIVTTGILVWSKREESPWLGLAGVAALSMFLLQSIIGAVTVWTDFSAALKATHLVGATLLWVSLMLVAAIHFANRIYFGVGRVV